MQPKFSSQKMRLAQLGIVMLSLFGFSQMAHATLAAEHVLENTVTVEYLDGSGTGVAGSATPYSDTDAVQITINLVQAAPDVSNTTSDTLDPVSTNEAITLEFTVTSNANGLDDYDLENVVFTNTGAEFAADTTTVASTVPASGTLPLGGTSFADTTSLTFDAAGTPSTTSVLVPMDGAADGVLSGFTTGASQLIVFDATGAGGAGEVVCTVDSVTEGALVNDTATIVISGCDSGGAAREVVFGDQMGERATLEINIVAGEVSGEIEFDADLNNTDDTNTVALGPITINIVAVDLRVEKFVRNVFNSDGNPASCGTATPFECLLIEDGASGVLYYATGVTADPSDTLEYAILLYNVNGQVTAVTGVDPAVLFTSYVDDSSVLYPTVSASIGGGAGTALCHLTNGTCTVDDGAGAAPTSVAASDDDASGDDFVFLDTVPDPDEVKFSAGDTGTANVAPTSETTGGQIPASPAGGTVANGSVFTFQVTVDS